MGLPENKTSSTGELVRNADSWAPSQIYWISTCIFTRFSADSCTFKFEKHTTVSATLLGEEKLFNSPPGSFHCSEEGRWIEKLDRAGIVTAKTLVRSQGEAPSCHDSPYTGELRGKPQHPVWKPSPVTFVDPHSQWYPGSREPCIRSSEWEDKDTNGVRSVERKEHILQKPQDQGCEASCLHCLRKRGPQESLAVLCRAGVASP